MRRPRPCPWGAPPSAGRGATSASSPMAPTCTSPCAWPSGWPGAASKPPASRCGAPRRPERRARDGIEAAVLDLRSLAPLDRAALLAVARHTGKVLVLHEDSRTGGIGESLAASTQEEAFESLAAPVRVMGALDTPVPYSPPLEEA